MAFTKIQNAPDYAGADITAESAVAEGTLLGVESLADSPGLSAATLKGKFDELARRFLAPFINHLITELGYGSAAAALGAMNGETESNVQTELERRVRTDEIDSKLLEAAKTLGSSGMYATVYDPNGRAQDIFAYADAAAQGAKSEAAQGLAGLIALRTDTAEGWSVTTVSLGAGGLKLVLASIELTDLSVSSAWGGLYSSLEPVAQPFTYPVEFTGAPLCTAMWQPHSFNTLPYFSASGSAAYAPTIKLLRGTSQSGGINGRLDLIAIGV